MEALSGSASGDVVATFDARVVLRMRPDGRYEANVVQRADTSAAAPFHGFEPKGLQGAVLRAVGAAESPLEWIAEDLSQARDRVAPVIDALVDLGLVASRTYRGAFSGCSALGGKILHRLTSDGHAALALMGDVAEIAAPAPSPTNLAARPATAPAREVAVAATESVDSRAARHEREAKPASRTAFQDGVMDGVRKVEGREVATARAVHKAMRFDVMPNAASLLTKVNATLGELHRNGFLHRDRVTVPGRHSTCPAYGYRTAKGGESRPSVATASAAPPSAPEVPVPPNPSTPSASFVARTEAAPAAAPKPATPASGPVPLVEVAVPPARAVVAETRIPRGHVVPETRIPRGHVVPDVSAKVGASPARRPPPEAPSDPKSRVAVAAAILSAQSAPKPLFTAPKLTAQERIERQVDPLSHLKDPVAAAVDHVPSRLPCAVASGPSRDDILAAMSDARDDRGWLTPSEIAAIVSPGSAGKLSEVLNAMHGEGVLWMRRAASGAGPGAFAYCLRKKDGAEVLPKAFHPSP